MPLPNPNADPDLTGGAAYSPNRFTNGRPVQSVLASGQPIHYVQPGTGTHIVTAIGNWTPTGEISIVIVDSPTRQHTQANVLYDGTTFAQGTWHFPSDG